MGTNIIIKETEVRHYKLEIISNKNVQTECGIVGHYEHFSVDTAVRVLGALVHGVIFASGLDPELGLLRSGGYIGGDFDLRMGCFGPAHLLTNVQSEG